MSYFHSVKLLDSECKGCTHCIRTCPTEAIRVRNGKATIITDRCIDCGECIRTCPNNAKIAVTDPLDEIDKFKYKIAIPAPSFVSQFSRRYSIEKVLAGFLFLGFDRVLEVGFGADLITSAISEYLNSAGAALPRPVISSACPAVIRLIQVRYPGLVGNIIPIQPPMEITARYVKEAAMRELGLPMSDIGVFFITPCPAKATAVKQPVGTSVSYVNGVIAIRDMVDHIKMNFDRIQPGNTAIQSASSLGLGWGRRGGEIDGLEIPNRLAVDGIHQVSRVLEKIENGGFQNINFLEAQACVCGCVGGVLTAENPFIAKLKLDIVSEGERGRKPRGIRKSAERNTQGILLPAQEDSIPTGHLARDRCAGSDEDAPGDRADTCGASRNRLRFLRLSDLPRIRRRRRRGSHDADGLPVRPARARAMPRRGNLLARKKTAACHAG